MIIYELVTDHKFTKVAEFLQEHFFKYAPLGLALGEMQSKTNMRLFNSNYENTHNN